MSESETGGRGEFGHWLDEKSEALKFRLGETFAAPSTVLQTPSVHLETAQQNLEEVLLEHESPSPEFLQELADLKSVQPLPDDELAQQALSDGGADGDSGTPE